MELEAGDSGLRTFVSVQGSLAMSAIHKYGSEEQKQQWLPRMAAGEAIGCFGLTEPTAGSDPANMKTFARRDGSGADADWVLNGSKRWIGLASVAEVADDLGQDRRRRARLHRPHRHRRASRPPRSSPSSRCAPPSSATSNSTDVRLPADALLPDAKGLRGPFECLNEARYGIIWGAMGAARDAYETAVDYAQERLQFGKPLAGYQLTQEKLVNMPLEIQQGHPAGPAPGPAQGRRPARARTRSRVGKLNNCREAIEIAREGRTILGGNGITLDYSPLRHANNLESVRTYEGTDEVHTLILGQHITGLPAFR